MCVSRPGCACAQSTVDGVAALMKRQEDFENRLIAQDERMKGLGDTADRLIDQGHSEKQMWASGIQNRNLISFRSTIENNVDLHSV